MCTMHASNYHIGASMRRKAIQGDFQCKQCSKTFTPSYHQRLNGSGFCTVSCGTLHTNAHRTYKRIPASVRLWKRVTKLDGDDACWIFTGAKYSWGHGVIGSPEGHTGAHRISWIEANGEIPEGLHVCHRCDNPSCVRPSHLFLGTHQDNMTDMKLKGRAHLGEAHGIAKLTNEKVLQIRSKYASGNISQKNLAKEFGVHVMTVNSIVHRRSWKHI